MIFRNEASGYTLTGSVDQIFIGESEIADRTGVVAEQACFSLRYRCQRETTYAVTLSI